MLSGDDAARVVMHQRRNRADSEVYKPVDVAGCS